DFLLNHDLGCIESFHLSGNYLDNEVAMVLSRLPSLHTLDLGYLCWRTYPRGQLSDYTFQSLCDFPDMASRPRVLRFCTRVDRVHAYALQDQCVNKARATRASFASLLREIDVSVIELLDVGAESLSLPIAAAYTWSSLRELTITGFWLHDDAETPLGDERARTPASIFGRVHLGTLVNAAPRLRALRVRCRYLMGYGEPRWTVWPPDDMEPPHIALGAGGGLDTFEYCNPSVADGVFAHLPSTLRTLALLAYPPGTHDTDPLKELELQEMFQPNSHTLVVPHPQHLMRALAITSLPLLRELRLSFRNLEDMRLFEFISETYPLLEVFEAHAEAGPGSIWAAPQLAACATALAPLVHLRSLRLNTFRNVLTPQTWDEIRLYTYFEGLTEEQKSRSGISKADVVAAIFPHEMPDVAVLGNPLGKSTDAQGVYFQRRWPKLEDVWLPRSRVLRQGTNCYKMWREWQVFEFCRSCDGQVDLRESSS
ncbi:hypothetical protein HDZ31DRAFT_155, partial [Schizophyllum fasciatum]